MNAQHTQGLEVVGNLVRTSMVQDGDRPRGILVAECFDGFGLHSDEAKANARLFAAASDLAMQAAAFTYTVERFMRAGDGSDPRVPPTEGDVAAALYALRAAIAKAVQS